MPGSRFPGYEALRKIERVEIVPLDVTDTESVTEQAEQNGARIDIVVNTAEHVRSGGVVDRHGLTVAREEMDIRYLGPAAARPGVRPGAARLAAPTASIPPPPSSICCRFMR